LEVPAATAAATAVSTNCKTKQWHTQQKQRLTQSSELNLYGSLFTHDDLKTAKTKFISVNSSETRRFDSDR
jgi:hypothetical protein